MKYSLITELFIVLCVVLFFTSPVLSKTLEIPGLELDNDIILEERDDTLYLTHSYNQAEASTFARLSSAAYCAARGENRLDNWSCQACADSGIAMDRVSKFSVITTDMYGYVAYSKALNRIFLVFRGSSNLSNWMTNLDFGHVDYEFAPGIKVHGGFMKAYKFARPILFGIIDSFFYDFPTAKLSISGHSLGGAIATHAFADFTTGKSLEVYEIAGIKFARNGSPYDDELPFTHTNLLNLSSQKLLRTNTNLLASGEALGARYQVHFPMYTFGAPRVGDEAWASWFNQISGGPGSLFRIVHYQDPVPHLPPLSMKFKHFPTEVYYNDDESQYVVCDASGEDESCSNQHWLPTKIDNHLTYLNYRIGNVDGWC